MSPLASPGQPSTANCTHSLSQYPCPALLLPPGSPLFPLKGDAPFRSVWRNFMVKFVARTIQAEDTTNAERYNRVSLPARAPCWTISVTISGCLVGPEVVLVWCWWSTVITLYTVVPCQHSVAPLAARAAPLRN